MTGTPGRTDRGRRDAARRSPLVVRLAQVPLRPLLTALAPPVWIGREHLPARGGAVVAANHQGPWDALAVGHLLQASGVPPRFLAKRAMFAVPVLGALLRASGQIPVDRGVDAARATGGALGAARAALGRGEVVTVFPEGTYTRDPAVWPMRARTGAARLALEAGVPLVPVACWGTRSVWPVGARLPRPLPRRRPILRVGAPLHPVLAPGETLAEGSARVTAELMAAITALLAHTRGDVPPPLPHDPRHDPVRPETGSRPGPAARRVLAAAAAAADRVAHRSAAPRIRR